MLFFNKLRLTLFFSSLLGIVLVFNACKDDFTEFGKNENLTAHHDEIVTLRSTTTNPYDSAGIMHNYYCNHIMDNTDILENDSLPYVLDSLENFFLNQLGIEVDLDSIATSDGNRRELLGFNEDFTDSEKDFLVDLEVAIDSFDWNQSNVLAAWDSTMNIYVSDALSASYTHSEAVLSAVSIAKHSGNLWYAKIAPADGSSLSEAGRACLFEAIVEDFQSLASIYGGDKLIDITFGQLAYAGVSSLAKYYDCKGDG